MAILLFLLIAFDVGYHIYEKRKIWRMLDEHFPQDEAEFDEAIAELMEMNKKCKN